MMIRFGKSGWQAVIADEFMFVGARSVTGGICSRFEPRKRPHNLMVVGYDSRFLAEQFAEECAQVISRNAFRALLCDGPVPTLTMSHVIRTKKASDAAPALPEVTLHVEEIIKKTDPVSRLPKTKDESVQPLAARPSYLEGLKSKINFDDTGRGYLDEVLRTNGSEVDTIHDRHDVLFGGCSEPEASQLEELREVVVSKSCAPGLATDGDADRFGVINANGSFITPNQLIALLFDYLVESRKWTGGAVRSVATSQLVDRVAKAHGQPVHETPVGFGELLNEDKIVIGGEESAGLSIKGHYPEKDGILACLLAAEAVAARGASLTEQLAELYRHVGKLEAGRNGIRLTPQLMESLRNKLKQDLGEICGRRVEQQIERMD